MIIKNNLIKKKINNSCDEYYTIRLLNSDIEKNYIDIYNCSFHTTYNPNNPLSHISYNDFINIENLYEYLNNLHKNYKKNHIFQRCHEMGYCDNNNICNSYLKKLDNITVSLQKRCNLNCIMCNVHDNDNNEIQKNLYFDTLYKIKNNNLRRISFTEVGEPFFYKKEMFEYLDSLTLNDCKELKIVTNLTLLNDDDIYHLYDIKIKKNINFYFLLSIDAITEETYKKIRNNNLFNKIIHNAELLFSLNIFNCNIHFVIMLENLHELPFLKEFWYNHGVKNNQHIYVTPIFDYAYHTKNVLNIIFNSNEYKSFINENN